jgi:hypothetical protein
MFGSLHVSLNCLFLIAPSVFSNVYYWQLALLLMRNILFVVVLGDHLQGNDLSTLSSNPSFGVFTLVLLCYFFLHRVMSNILLLICVVFFVLFVFVLCFVYPMLPVSLDCPFLHTHKTKARVTRTPINTRGELMCSGRVGSSCSTSGIRRVNIETNPVITHKWGKDREVCPLMYSFLLPIWYLLTFLQYIYRDGFINW